MVITRSALVQALKEHRFIPNCTIQLYRQYPVGTSLDETDRQRATETSRRYIDRLLSRVGLKPSTISVDCRYAEHGIGEKRETIDENGEPKTVKVRHISPVVYHYVQVKIPTWRLWLYRRCH